MNWESCWNYLDISLNTAFLLKKLVWFKKYWPLTNSLQKFPAFHHYVPKERRGSSWTPPLEVRQLSLQGIFFWNLLFQLSDFLCRSCLFILFVNVKFLEVTCLWVVSRSTFYLTFGLEFHWNRTQAVAASSEPVNFFGTPN